MATYKARMALKRQEMYRTDEAYRKKVREKAEKSKQRDEYKINQRAYNRLYYLKMKEKLKERRRSKKLSISGDEDTEIKAETSVEEYEETQEEADDDVVEEEEEEEDIIGEEMVEEEELVEEQVEFTPEEIIIETPATVPGHSYPRVRSPTTRKRRKNTEISVQVDMEPLKDKWTPEKKNHGKIIVQVVDVGTQVSETDLMWHQENMLYNLIKD